jgi:hypothetical protein
MSIYPAVYSPVEPARARRFTSGQFLLLVFVGIVGALAIATGIHYRSLLVTRADFLLFAVWLFLVMVAGMFVQVLVAHRQKGKGLFDIEASELAIPLLFSIVVFYSMWGVAAATPKSFFSFYAAFINGYFWRNVMDRSEPIIAPDLPKSGSAKSPRSVK